MRKERVIFTNECMYWEHYDVIDRKYVRHKIEEDQEFSILYSLDVEFEDGLTVEGFLKNLRPYINFIEFHFQSFVGSHDLKQFFDLLDKPCDKEYKNDDVSYIEMYWHCELWEVFNIPSNKLSSEFNLWGGYHGISKTSDIKQSFSLTPLNNWKHHKFILNNKLVCFKNTETTYNQVLFESELKWTLHDIIKNFFYELTFYGSLTDIDNFKKSLEGEIDKLNNSPEETIIINFDEFEIETLEEDLKEAIENEEYELAARIRNKISDIKKRQDNKSNLL